MAKSSVAKRPAPRRKAQISLAQAGRILTDYRKRPAVMSDEVMTELEAVISQDTYGVTRRLALALLTQPAAELIANVGKDREFAEAVASVFDCLNRYRDCLCDLQSWMEEAHKRIAVALATREDMAAVLAEGKASNARAIAEAEVAHV